MSLSHLLLVMVMRMMWQTIFTRHWRALILCPVEHNCSVHFGAYNLHLIQNLTKLQNLNDIGNQTTCYCTRIQKNVMAEIRPPGETVPWWQPLTTLWNIYTLHCSKLTAHCAINSRALYCRRWIVVEPFSHLSPTHLKRNVWKAVIDNWQDAAMHSITIHKCT